MSGDELQRLIEQLEGEVVALDAALDARDAQLKRQLDAQRQLRDAARARLAHAQSSLASDQSALGVLGRRRTELRARVESWRGELWRTGHGTAAIALVLAAMVPLPAVTIWLGSGWTLGLVGVQAALFAAAWLLTREKS